MTDHTDAPAADLSALRRNYTFDRARDAIATAVAQLADARATLILAERLHDHLGVMDHRLLTHSILTLDDDLHTLQEALAATTAALARFRGLPQPARIREYVADDGVPVVQIDTAPDAAPIRVNLNDTRIHDVATAPQAATPNTADYWPTEAGLVALNATAGDYGRH